VDKREHFEGHVKKKKKGLQIAAKSYESIPGLLLSQGIKSRGSTKKPRRSITHIHVTMNVLVQLHWEWSLQVKQSGWAGFQ
jgi:hypothetical protein